MVVACTALAIALGGTGYAAMKLPKNSVGTKQLKKNAVVSSKVKNNSLLGADINESSLGTVPSAANAANATHAAGADTATHAAAADSAGHATNADTAHHAAAADTATSADTAKHAAAADTATNAAKLGGIAAMSYPTSFVQTFTRNFGTFQLITPTGLGEIDLSCDPTSALFYKNDSASDSAAVGYDDGGTNFSGWMNVGPGSFAASTRYATNEHVTWLLQETYGGKTHYSRVDVFFSSHITQAVCDGVAYSEQLNHS